MAGKPKKIVPAVRVFNMKKLILSRAGRANWIFVKSRIDCEMAVRDHSQLCVTTTVRISSQHLLSVFIYKQCN